MKLSIVKKEEVGAGWAEGREKVCTSNAFKLTVQLRLAAGDKRKLQLEISIL